MKCLRLSSLLLYSNNRKCNVKCIRNISSSINEEVEKFSKVGKDWWNKNSNQGTGDDYISYYIYKIMSNIIIFYRSITCNESNKRYII